MLKIIGAVMIVLLAGMNVSCPAADSIKEVEMAKVSAGKSLKDKDLTDLQKIILTMIDEEERSRKWSLELSGSYSRDDAGDQTKSELGSSITLKKGYYPRQLRFNVKTKVQYQQGKLTENVTSYLLNYDYYMESYLEVYGFIERFTDTYLSIDHRFEIGFGVKREWELLGFVKDKAAKEMTEIERLYQNLSAGQRDTLGEYKESTITSIKKRCTKLLLGVAVSLFDELEQAKDLKLIDSDTLSFSVPSSSRFRIVVRPSFEWKISKELCIEGECYFKLPVFNDYKVDDRFDYRIDANVQAGLSLAEDKQGNEKASLKIGYNYKYDNVPPFRRIGDKLYSAENDHGMASFSIALKL
jgi:hypothetical protein